MPKANLKAIQAERKRLARIHPSWSNAQLLKEAWRLKGPRKTITGVKRKKTAVKKRRAVSGVKRRATPKRTVVHVRRVVSGVRRKVGTMGDVREKARASAEIIRAELGEFMARSYLAKTKTEKRKIGKRIAELKKQLSATHRVLGK